MKPCPPPAFGHFRLIILLAYILVNSGLLLAQPDRAPTPDSVPESVESAGESDTNTLETKNDAKLSVYYFQVFEEIFPPALRLLENALEGADKAGADLLFMELDTYGGAVDVADEMRTLLLNSEMRTVVLVRNNAASAGALLSIACDSIYMTPGSTIGAATVVNQEGAKVDEKYQSYMRTKMRATAEAKGRNPDIAEGMVDDRVSIEGVTEEGKIITFTVDDAIENDYCEGKAENREEVLELMGIVDYDLVEHQVGETDKVINFFLNPAVSSILILIIIGGIYFELQTPGVGFPIIASAVAALLYFVPMYLEGLAANWEILMFILGLILLILEFFVIPGFGVAGIAGSLMVIGALTLAMLNNIQFDFTFVPVTDIGKAMIVVMVPFLAALIAFLAFGGALFESGALRHVALQAEQRVEDGYVIGEAHLKNQLIGKTGVAATDLRPSGKIEVEGDRYDAQAEAEFIEKGEKVKLVGTRSAYIIVTKA